RRAALYRGDAVREHERRIGAEPLGATEIVGKISIRSVKILEQTLLETALRSRPDLRARQAEIQRLDADLSLTRRLVVPNPTLAGIYEEESEAPGSRDRIAGGAVRIPL